MRTTHLFGLDFAVNTSIAELAEMLVRDGQTTTAQWRVVVTPNVDHLVRYRKSLAQRQVAENARLVLPDGAPIVWVSRRLGSPIDQRLAGSDLFAEWWHRMVAAQRPLLLIAGNQALADFMTREHPGCRCIVPPRFDEDDEVAIAAVADGVLKELQSRPVDAVVVGLSMPKHHAIAAHLRAAQAPASGTPLLLLLGASAEFYAGQQRRAPKWMQRIGMEWLYRLLSHPRRFAKRYLIDDVAFFPIVWREWRTRRATLDKSDA